MPDAFWSQTFAFFCFIVFEVTHILCPQKMTNKWPSHFHHPQNWTIDLMFKIMKSTNTWQFLRAPLSIPFCVEFINACFLSGFLKFGQSHVWMQMNFEFYENSVKLSSVKLSKKPSSYFQLYQLLFEQLFDKFMSATIIYVCYSWQDFLFKM